MCALPSTIDPATPTGGSARSLGDDQIRALKQFLVDVFGLPNNSAISAATFTIDTTGTITAILLSGQLIDAKYIDFDDTANAATEIWLKASRPVYRLIGTEASAKDWRIVEDAGNIVFQENTGTEAAPTWAARVLIGSTGNIKIYSGQANAVEFDHAATAERTWTFQDATDTVVGRATTDTLTNKTITTPTLVAESLASGSPAVTGRLYRENLVRAWAYVTYAGGVPTLQNDHNISGIVDNGVGDITFTIDLDLANTNFCCGGTASDNAVPDKDALVMESQVARVVGSVRMKIVDVGIEDVKDPLAMSFWVFGDSA